MLRKLIFLLLISITGNSVTLEELPTELHELIIGNLPVNNLKKFCATSRKLRPACETELFWERVSKRDFGVAIAEKFYGLIGSWKNLYPTIVTASKKNAQYLKVNGKFESNDPMHKIVAFADFQNMRLVEARIRGGIFYKANLSSATMIGAQDIDFSHANMRKAKLSGKFSGKFINTDLSSADLQRCIFGDTHTDFTYANLTDADLTYVTFRDVKLANANLSNANFSSSYRQVGATRKVGVRLEYTLLRITKEWLRSQGAFWDESKPPLGID